MNYDAYGLKHVPKERGFYFTFYLLAYPRQDGMPRNMYMERDKQEIVTGTAVHRNM